MIFPQICTAYDHSTERNILEIYGHGHWDRLFCLDAILKAESEELENWNWNTENSECYRVLNSCIKTTLNFWNRPWENSHRAFILDCTREVSVRLAEGWVGDFITNYTSRRDLHIDFDGFVLIDSDWCWFYYFVRNSVITWLDSETLCVWILSFGFVYICFFRTFFLTSFDTHNINTSRSLIYKRFEKIWTLNHGKGVQLLFIVIKTIIIIIRTVSSKVVKVLRMEH